MTPGLVLQGDVENRPITIGRRKKLLFAAAMLLGIPLLAETVVRIRDAIRFGSTAPADQLYLPHPQLGKVLRPGATLSGATTKVRINSLGFRGPEISVPKPPGTFRIACLGGSTTFGTYSSSDETTWPAFLQQKIQQRCPHLRVEVINAGVPGYRLAESRINLLQRVVPIDPDLVIVYHACNDISSQQARAFGSQSQIASQPMIGTQWLTRHSLLFDKLAKNIRIMQTPATEPHRRDRLPDSAVRTYRQHLESLLAECRDRNIPAALCTMATQFRADQPENIQRKAAGTALYYNEYLSVEGLIHAYRTFNEALQTVAEEHRLPSADLVAAVPGQSRYFGDSVHFTDAGCRRVADCIFAALVDAGLIPQDPQRPETP